MNNNKSVRLVGLVAIIAGIVLILAGGVTWGMVRSQLVEEKITVAEDASHFANAKVTGPLEAYWQADIIKHHSLEAGGGKTYAELGRDDPIRAVVMNGSFLRASLFTSVIAFGVAAFAIGMGVMFVLVGWALRSLGAAPAVAPTARETLTA
ncbi:MAG TPA: aromatic ring-opening dioxygenase LigA [Actinotalea sp.]|jgi:hypothetical protein